MADDTEEDTPQAAAPAATAAPQGAVNPTKLIYDSFYNHAKSNGADDAGAQEFAHLGLGVASREGLSAKNLWGNSGDQGRSWGPFQLLVGGGLGDQMGSDRSPQNQIAVAARNMWGEKGNDGYYNTAPWNGAGDYMGAKGNSSVNDSEAAQQAMIDLGRGVAAKGGASSGAVDPRSFQASAAGSGGGALGGDNIAGGLGALSSDPPQSMGSKVGEALTGIGMNIAAINNPAQAQALQSQLTAMQGKKRDPLNDAYKRTLIAATLKKLQPDAADNSLTYKGVAPDGKMMLFARPDGTIQDGKGNPVTEAPQAPVAAPDANDMKPLEMTNYTKYQSGAQNASSTVDVALDLQHRLASNPEIARYLGFAQDGKTLIANGMGESTVAGQFVKDVNAAQSKGLIDIVKDVGAKAQNIKFQQLEKDAIAPNGSLQDPETLYGVLGRISDSSKRGYMTNMTGLQTYEKKYGKSLTYLDSDGNLATPSAVHALNLERWKNQQAANQQSYDTILHPNHNIAAGVTTAPTLTQRLQSAFPQQQPPQ